MIFQSIFLLFCALRVVQAFTTESPIFRFDRATTTTRLSCSESDGLVVVEGVTLKIAFDAQGGVVDLSEEKSERFTCGESLDMVHRLRRVSDAVLVGRSTVEIDDCTLTVRRVPTDKKQPTRVILDPTLQLNLEDYKIFNDGLDTIVVFAMTDELEEKALDKKNNHDNENVTFLGLKTIHDEGKERIGTKQLCNILADKFDIHHIMVEGGPNTALSFLKDGMVDRAILVTAPISFKEPLLANMSRATLTEAGLEEVGDYSLGVDSVKCFARDDILWPSTDVSSWP